MNVVMIMCHKNADQVIRFAKRCKTDRTDIIIHCDSLMPELEYEKMVTFSRSGGGILN